jgi:hypothetical protein
MSLGLGNGLNKTRVKKKYILDRLGIVDSCVLGFAEKRLTNRYKGFHQRIMRESDSAVLDVGFVGENVDTSAVAAFCTGTTGRRQVLYNQSIFPGVQNAIQNDWNKMPIVFESGSYNSDGTRFVVASTSKMVVTNYAEIDIDEPILSIYCNYLPDNADGVMLAKTKLPDVQQFTLESSDSGGVISCWMFDWTNRRIAQNNIGINKYLVAWQNKAANGLKYINQIGPGTSTLNETLIKGGDLVLGMSVIDPTFIYNGKIKSVIIFNSDQYNNYTNLVAAGL